MGGAPLFKESPDKWPWWWTHVLLLEEKFHNIRESAAYDIERMAPPKEFWLDDDRLNEWYEERKMLREKHG